MYTSFFGLNEKPFSITPDPRYLFMSERHGEALAHLVYGVTESGGFVQLTGEVGTGKTTLVRTLLQNRLPDNADVAVVLNPQISVKEFLATIAEELAVDNDVDIDSIKSMTDALNAYLLKAHAEGRRVILIVDEAQNLSPNVLEQVRLLTNLETAKQKLLQIILIGQPELRELLARNDLRQLAQRITGRYHLEPLSRKETEAYIRHRLRVAGALNDVFDTAAMRTVFQLSQGIPRLINVICDRALLGAYARESRRVTRSIVRRAASEIAGTEDIAMWRHWMAPTFGVLSILTIGTGLYWFISQQGTPIHASLPETVVAAEAQPEPEPEPEPEQPEELEPPVETIEPAAPALGEQLVMASALTTAARSYAELQALWGVDAEAGDCNTIRSRGFECLRQRGSMGMLRQLDRPAVLELIDDAGQAHHVLLKALQGNQALLSVGGVEVSHSVSDVSRFWRGQFLVLWRPPNGQAIALFPGTDHINVRWLRQSLAAIDPRYASTPANSTAYDESLEQRVREFQRDNRLEVDGFAGSQTQIIINGLLAPADTPRLATPRLARD
ncbi:MAG: AAA family ATPase [Woeseiaceae bacterium]|nr:AAA family ATPase [Woeseiaceae bacterium]